MKAIVYVFLWLVSISTGWSRASADQPYSGPWGPLSNHAQMSIELDSSAATNKPALVFPMEEPRSLQEASTNEAVVILSVRLRNVSTNVTFFFVHAGEVERSSAPSFDIVLPSGKSVAVRPKHPNAASSGGVISLGPGQVREFKFHANRFCGFGEVGTYRITGTWKLETAGSTGSTAELVSNPLQILVTRTPWKAAKIER